MFELSNIYGTLSLWVDLGLPSGLLWANCNLGASSLEDYGNYYAWGEVTTKEVYNWGTYRYCTVDGEGSLQTLTKYNTDSNYGTPDNLTTLQANDDAATAVLGNETHIPTTVEWQELINNTTMEWITINGVNGWNFNSSNGNSLFLPAAGYQKGSELRYVGSDGYYWSSSLIEEEPNYVRSIYFSSDGLSENYGSRRCDGLAVRAVRVK